MPIFPANNETIQRAAELLRSGDLVAFPTETVYGLGANALDANAVAKIFAAKERPSYNPLIVHVLDEDAARELVTIWPQRAQLLARHFWPGALTIVLPKRESISDIVTAGLNSVALRAPSHAVARRLLEAAQIPLAAPSANKFTQTSPTRASHVANSLGDEIFILDGGACQVGIESTVLDLCGDVPLLLRPGTITQREIENVLGASIDIEYSNDDKSDDETPRRAPGQVRRHYAPRAQLRVFWGEAELGNRIRKAQQRKHRVGLLLLRTETDQMQRIVRMPNEPHAYAAAFYNALHEMDAQNCDVILVENVPQSAAWNGVRDRLLRASA